MRRCFSNYILVDDSGEMLLSCDFEMTRKSNQALTFATRDEARAKARQLEMNSRPKLNVYRIECKITDKMK